MDILRKISTRLRRRKTVAGTTNSNRPDQADSNRPQNQPHESLPTPDSINPNPTLPGMPQQVRPAKVRQPLISPSPSIESLADDSQPKHPIQRSQTERIARGSVKAIGTSLNRNGMPMRQFGEYQEHWERRVGGVGEKSIRNEQHPRAASASDRTGWLPRAGTLPALPAPVVQQTGSDGRPRAPRRENPLTVPKATGSGPPQLGRFERSNTAPSRPQHRASKFTEHL
ncbi:hypothetical protein EG329_013930 [Mollisiaceae sp. DMI_Dod_QoI]|nr:hypothetical protein EG329_013930 [Helotiales sp. DMI_Dod_QoI]